MAEENKKILKRRKEENPKKKKTRKSKKKQTVGEHWEPGIPSSHLIHGILMQERLVITYNQE